MSNFKAWKIKRHTFFKYKASCEDFTGMDIGVIMLFDAIHSLQQVNGLPERFCIKELFIVQLPLPKLPSRLGF